MPFARAWVRLASRAEARGVTVCLEQLNTRDDTHPMKGHPGYQGDDMDYCAEIVRRVGSEVKDAAKVEVPIECVVPQQDQWWTSDSRSEIIVPLGRAGALKLDPVPRMARHGGLRS